MSATERPIWREAMKDKSHPLHQATWTIFREKMSLKTVDRVLSDQKETVIPFLFAILEDENLEYEGSLGNGFAPVHAIEILGHWQVPEAVPVLFRILEEIYWDTLLHDKAILALEKYPCDIRDDLIAFSKAGDHDRRITMTSILWKTCPGDDTAFNFMVDVLTEIDSSSRHQISFVGEMMLHSDTERAIPILEKHLKRIRDKNERERLASFLETARAGKWNYWKKDN